MLKEYQKTALIEFTKKNKKAVAKYLLSIGYEFVSEMPKRYKFMFNNTKPKPNPYGLSDADMGKIRMPLVLYTGEGHKNEFEQMAIFIFETLKMLDLISDNSILRGAHLLEIVFEGKSDDYKLDEKEAVKDSRAFGAVLLKELYGMDYPEVRNIDFDRYNKIFEQHREKIKELLEDDVRINELFSNVDA